MSSSRETSPGDSWKASVELRSAKGRWHGTVPRTPRRLPAASRRKVGDTLSTGLRQSWKKLRRRARKGLPGPRSKNLDEAVHELRAAARRFHSIARILPDSVPNRKAKRALRVAEDLLDSTGDFRDITVQHDGLESFVRGNSKVAKKVDRYFRRRHRREARKLSRAMDSLRLRKAHRRLRRLAKDLRADKKSRDTAARTLAAAFDEIRSARQNVNPTDPRSVHRLRIALKRFRYILEILEPVLPAVRGQRASSVKSLQRTMGDIRDNETLVGTLSAKAKDAPQLLPDTAAVLVKLDRRHGSMMRSFLKSVDAILAYWEGLVDAFRESMRQAGSPNA